MKYFKIIVIVLFVAGVGLYAGALAKDKADQDPNRPVITSQKNEIEVPADYTEEQLKEGLSAWDEEDGNLTDQILIGEFSQFIEKGVCNVSYIVFDSANQPATLSRKVRFTGYESPKFTLSSPLVFESGMGTDILGRIGASDMLDGNVSSMVKQTGSDVAYQVPGVYTIHVEVTNSLGDVSSAALPVHIVEPSAQLLNNKAPLIYLKKGTAFDANTCKSQVTDAHGQPLDPAKIQVVSNVNINEEGVYEIQLTSEAGVTWTTVIVRE